MCICQKLLWVRENLNEITTSKRNSKVGIFIVRLLVPTKRLRVFGDSPQNSFFRPFFLFTPEDEKFGVGSLRLKGPYEVRRSFRITPFTGLHAPFGVTLRRATSPENSYLALLPSTAVLRIVHRKKDFLGSKRGLEFFQHPPTH